MDGDLVGEDLFFGSESVYEFGHFQIKLWVYVFRFLVVILWLIKIVKKLILI